MNGGIALEEVRDCADVIPVVVSDPDVMDREVLSGLNQIRRDKAGVEQDRGLRRLDEPGIDLTVVEGQVDAFDGREIDGFRGVGGKVGKGRGIEAKRFGEFQSCGFTKLAGGKRSGRIGGDAG